MDERVDKKQNNSVMTKVTGLILIGGKSSRMGSPKHLMKMNTQNSQLEFLYQLLLPYCDKICVAGKGELPEALQSCVRIEDYHEAQGPVAGILGGMQSFQNTNWIVLACDMPRVSGEAIEWLLAQRVETCYGVVPLDNNKRPEPLFAYYSHRALQLFKEMAEKKIFRVGRVVENEGIITPEIPDHLRHCWSNINSPEELNKMAEK